MQFWLAWRRKSWGSGTPYFVGKDNQGYPPTLDPPPMMPIPPTLDPPPMMPIPQTLDPPPMMPIPQTLDTAQKTLIPQYMFNMYLYQ